MRYNGTHGVIGLWPCCSHFVEVEVRAFPFTNASKNCTLWCRVVCYVQVDVVDAMWTSTITVGLWVLRQGSTKFPGFSLLYHYALHVMSRQPLLRSSSSLCWKTAIEYGNPSSHSLQLHTPSSLSFPPAFIMYVYEMHLSDCHVGFKGRPLYPIPEVSGLERSQAARKDRTHGSSDCLASVLSRLAL